LSECELTIIFKQAIWLFWKL